MHLSTLLLAATSVVGIAAQSNHPLMRRADDNAPETAANKTTVEPKRFIVEFDKVRLVPLSSASIYQLRK